ncbi:MAG TPA: aminotransferase class I/II-fold pyridoxal phosphate-dependent enzyme [Candidatus Sulfotelmatobacter sp.]|jgi:aspartate/methionine/tyrosine aminotransferase|nr:aminotransferase class I/II-fold pyridoxal phosphate-dependent enzyme [Candidatus Sulfotelmatobacter sp.]
MQITPFRIEEYMGKHEFSARYLLSSSDAESVTIEEILSLEPGAHDAFLKHWCGYTESPGAPWLREVLATIYKTIHSDQLVVVSAAEEAIFLFYHALLTPQDHAIVETPCYESALTLPKSIGASVSEWRRKPEDGWAHDLAALEAMIRPNTRALYINTPHNPTGLLMPAEIFHRVLELAANHNIYVFSDEVYRELEHDPATRLPAACDLYDRAISLGSVSKTYGLPGLRLAWLASHDKQFLQKIISLKHYTTICASAPSEFLTAVAFRHRQKFIDRNLRIVSHNLKLLGEFFGRHNNLFEWTAPNAATIGFARFKPRQDVLEWCEKLVRDTGVLLLPGTVYDEPRHIRFGYGRKNMPESLEQFEAYLKSTSFAHST